MDWEWCLEWTMFFAIVDLALPRAIEKDDSSRWFAIHVVGNMVIIWLTVNDLWDVMKNPLYDVVVPVTCTPWVYRKGPSMIAMIMHLYHIFFFRNLKPIDWLHHLVSAFGSGGVALLMDWGKSVNAQLFFLSGLPGGIDYFLLLMVKLGYMHPLTEKKMNVYLNLCLRIPGLLFLSTLTHVNILYHQNLFGVPLYIGWLATFANIWNALYFGNRVFASYYSTKI